MRLGKKKEKEKESEPKSQVVEGVSRLICSAKTHSVPLKGTVHAGSHIHCCSSAGTVARFKPSTYHKLSAQLHF
jgi:hypothetical protein